VIKDGRAQRRVHPKYVKKSILVRIASLSEFAVYNYNLPHDSEAMYHMLALSGGYGVGLDDLRLKRLLFVGEAFACFLGIVVSIDFYGNLHGGMIYC
jgi:hypothetical protein